MIRTTIDRSASDPDFVLVTAPPVVAAVAGAVVVIAEAAVVTAEAAVVVTGCVSPPKLAKHTLELAWPQQLSTRVCPILVQNWHTPSTSC